jgi:predicted transcriptional regulator YheO
VFQARNSAALVAKTLGVSRASIYNLLAHAKRIKGKSR